TLGANEALIGSNADCQRLALLSYFKTSRNSDEGQPVKHTIDNNAVLGKVDWTLGKASTLSVSYNFNFSNNENQTFDVATYGTSPAAAGGYRPQTVGCSNGTYVTAPATCPSGSTTTGGPLLFYLQSSSPDGIARDAAGESDINNEELSLFVQDKWRAARGVTI